MTRNKLLVASLSRFGLMVAALMTLLFLGACGGTNGDDVEVYDSAAPVLDIRLSDSEIDMQRNAATGKAVLKVTNNSADEQEIKIQGPGVDENFKVKAGETETKEVDLETGSYMVSTNDPDHGMGFNLTVTETGMGTPGAERNGTHKPANGGVAAERNGAERDSVAKAPEPPPAPVVAPLEIRLSESDIAMPASISAGQKSLKISNTSSAVQSFKIEGSGLDQELVASLQPGETKTLDVNLKPGTYKVTFGLTRELNVTQ
jgi:hypothetical protein